MLWGWIVREPQPVGGCRGEVGWGASRGGARGRGKKDLLSLAVFSDTDVRQHFFLKDLPGVEDAFVAEHALRRAALADVVERDGAILDDESLLERGAHHLHQLRVREVVHDMLEDVAVGDEAERAEDDHYRHFLPNVWQRTVDGRAIDALHRVAGK